MTAVESFVLVVRKGSLTELILFGTRVLGGVRPTWGNNVHFLLLELLGMNLLVIIARHEFLLLCLRKFILGVLTILILPLRY